MHDAAGASPPEDGPRRWLTALAWVVLVLFAVGSFLAAGRLLLDRDRLKEDVASTRAQLEDLRGQLGSTEQRIEDLERGLEQQQEEVDRRGDSLARCRQALERLSEAWNDMAASIRAAGMLDRADVRRLAAQANARRQASLAAARRCP